MISVTKRTQVHPDERRIILEHADDPGYDVSLDCYLRHGGYEEMKQAFAGMMPEEICQEVMDSEVRGRGGAGFPAGMKWKFLDRRSGKPIYLICNADESEPGTFKDRQIIHKDPHQLIESMMITAYAIQAKLAIIYIREEMPLGARILEEAIEEARARNLVGDNILGSGYSCDRSNRWKASAPIRASSRRIFRPRSGSTCARPSSTTWRRCAT